MKAQLPLSLASLTVLSALTLTACTDNPQSDSDDGSTSASGEAQSVQVTIDDDSCTVDPAEVPAGTVTFEISNEGSVPNELEVLSEDQLQIESEQENIGPGTTAELTTALNEGTYYTACKPNMVGDLLGTAEFSVTPGETVDVSEDTQAAEDQAIENCSGYVRDQTGQLLTGTQEFADAYTSGDYDEARRLYPLARQHYERIEPTAESFGIEEAGDLDASMDARVQDLAADAGKEPNDPEVLEEWTGWHRIEADLFTEDSAGFKFASDQERKDAADKLVDDTQTLYDFVYGDVEGVGGTFELELSDVVDGSSGLLEEVALSKIVGEEETFSHTDLYDFKANIEGAAVAYGNVQDLVRAQDPDLADEIEGGFDDVNALIDEQATGEDADGNPIYPSYADIAAVQEDATGEAPTEEDYTETQRDFSDAVNGLSEPLSEVAGTVLH